MEYLENMSALIVDDSNFFASLAADKIAAEHGIRTETAASASEALNILGQTDPDCVVSDYDMPGTDGLELYHELSSEYPSLPFILLTGRSDGDIASTAIAEGVDDFILKESVSESNDFEVLANRIENVVSQRKARRKYEHVVDSIPESIAQVRRDGTVLAANDNVAELFDTVPERLVGESVRDVIPGDVGSQWLAYGDDALTRDEEVSFESSYDGRHYHTIVVPVDIAGVPDSFQVLSRDITARVRRREELEETTDQLQLVNSLVRHDIRNDIDLVHTWARLVDESAEDAEVSKLAEKIQSTSEHIIELTDISGEFVDLVSGDGEAQTEPTPLRPVVTDEVEKRQQAYENASFVCNDEIPDVTVVANELLASVFRNLLNNAVQHSGTAEPEVRISARVDGSQGRVTVIVADDGPGVPEDQREDIFGKGEQGPESASSGVGLYLVHTLVEQYGGSVYVEDSHLGGAAFVIELPLAG